MMRLVVLLELPALLCGGTSDQSARLFRRNTTVAKVATVGGQDGAHDIPLRRGVNQIHATGKAAYPGAQVPFPEPPPQPIDGPPAHKTDDMLGSIPCDGYWLVEESDAGDYSKLNVSSLGFQTNRSVCTNADDSLAGKSVTLAEYLEAKHSDVTKSIKENLLPHVRGGAATMDLVIQDLESPKGIHPRLYGELNDTQLAKVVQATRLRIQVARELMPNASLALYATAVNASSSAITGYRRAAKLGLWDQLTHLIPVLYTGPNMHGSGLQASVKERLDASIAIVPSDGRKLPLAPVLSWRMFGAGRDADCAVSPANLASDLADIREWDAAHPGRIQALQWWSGTDHDADGKNGSSSCGGVPQVSYLEWLTTARIVPASCLPPLKTDEMTRAQSSSSSNARVSSRAAWNASKWETVLLTDAVKNGAVCLDGENHTHHLQCATPLPPPPPHGGTAR